MDTTIILSGMVIFLLTIFQHSAMKPCANLFPAKASAVFTSMWFIIGLIGSLPFFGHMLYLEGELFLTALPTWKILLSFCKGLVLFFTVTLAQTIRKESMSSAAFTGPIALGISAIINGLFFGEILKQIQLASLVGIGAIGGIFFFYGHAKQLTKTAKINFLLLILGIIYCIVSDQIVITASNWYVHVVLYFSGMILASMTQIKKIENIKAIILNKNALMAGFAIVSFEMFLLSTMVTVIPVSIAVFFMNLSLPVIMLLSAQRWKENKWQEQLAYGVIAFALAMPLVFG